MGIAAVRIISESEIATVMKDFNAQWAAENPIQFNKILKDLGFDTNFEIEVQEGLTHRNSFGAVITCTRWVGSERTDPEWLNSGHASQEAKDKANGSKLLEDLYRQRGMTE